jgi:uncharacterized membrane protein (DUF485 family)
MSEGTASDARPASPGAQEGRTSGVEWTRIERSAEFRELTARRHRFIAACATVTFGVFLVYLFLATFATGLMGTTVGGVPIAWLAAMSQVLLTWAVTWAYLRRADGEFAPLERRVADSAGPRFTRERDVQADAPATAPDERSAR